MSLKILNSVQPVYVNTQHYLPNITHNTKLVHLFKGFLKKCRTSSLQKKKKKITAVFLLWLEVFNEIPTTYNTGTFMSLTTFLIIRFSTEIFLPLWESIHAQRLKRTYNCSARSQTPSLCRLVLNCLLRFKKSSTFL